MHCKIDEDVLKKKWFSFCFELKEIKTKWLEFKQNVDLNGLQNCKIPLIGSVSDAWPEREPAVSNRLRKKWETQSKWSSSMLC